jgi:hypothetical protein
MPLPAQQRAILRDNKGRWPPNQAVVKNPRSDIRRELHDSIFGLQWGGRFLHRDHRQSFDAGRFMADRFGHWLVFQIGVGLFTLGSRLCCLAQGIHGLIAFRVVQGLGVSMLNPVAMSIITDTFHETKARARHRSLGRSGRDIDGTRVAPRQRVDPDRRLTFRLLDQPARGRGGHGARGRRLCP